MKIIGKLGHYVMLLNMHLLVLVFLLMLLFSIITIIGRYFDLYLIWMDVVIRHLVLLVALLGGAIAMRRGTHIGIDVVNYWLDTRKMVTGKKILQLSILPLALLGVGWLTYAAWKLLQVEISFQHKIVGPITSAHFAMILPFGLSLICVQAIFLTLEIATKIICGENTKQHEIKVWP